MTLTEATKSMLDVLPEADVRVVYTVTKSLFDKEASPFKPLSRQQILDDLEISRQQIESGDYLDFDEAISQIEAEYGL